jgi:tetratricopeptide (TPR) repeat protein
MMSRFSILLASILLLPAFSTPHADVLAEVDSLLHGSGARPAMAFIDSLLPAARARGDSSVVQGFLERRGFVYATFGQSRQAETALLEARRLAESGGDSDQLCNILRWLGVAVDGQGRADEATEIYNELADLAVARGDSLHQGWAQVGLAWRDFQSGRQLESVIRYRRAIVLFRAVGEVRGRIWALNGLGTCLTKLGDHSGAMEAFKEVAVDARSRGDQVMESMAQNNLGSLAYNQGAPDLAMEHFARARDLQIASGYRKGALRPAFNVAICLQELGRLDEAADLYEAQVIEARASQWWDLAASALGKLAYMAMQRGRPHLAVERYREALTDTSVLPLKTATELRVGLALALMETGETEAALRMLIEGEKKLEGSSDAGLRLFLDLTIGEILLEAGRQREALARFEGVAERAAELDQVGPGVGAMVGAASTLTALGRPAEALDRLHEAAEVWETMRGLPLDPQWRERFGAAGHLLYTDLAQALLRPRPGTDRAGRHREAFDRLQRFKSRTLLERILGEDEERTAVNLVELQTKVLSEGELLLDLYLGPERSLLFAVTRESCRAELLPGEDELTGRLRKLHRFLSRPPTGDATDGDLTIIRAAASGLGESLFGGIDSLIAASRSVILVPDGPLNLLAPALLQGDEPSSCWTRIPSATLLAHLRENGRELVMPSAGGLALAGTDSAILGELPGARREVMQLADRYLDVQSRELSDLDSSRTAHELLSAPRFLHLATHASLDDQNPWQSGLHLGPAGRLSAAEIAHCRFDARLAVLAACSSGSGRLLSGEGVLGLTTAFLAAGVPAVVATLWPVDDSATARFSTFFYEALAGGLGAGESLRLAQERLRAEPATSHPFFWSGFILVGDGEPGLALESRSLLAREGWHGGLLILALALLGLALRGSRFPLRSRKLRPHL